MERELYCPDCLERVDRVFEREVDYYCVHCDANWKFPIDAEERRDHIRYQIEIMKEERQTCSQK